MGGTWHCERFRFAVEIQGDGCVREQHLYLPRPMTQISLAYGQSPDEAIFNRMIVLGCLWCACTDIALPHLLEGYYANLHVHPLHQGCSPITFDHWSTWPQDFRMADM